MSELVRGHTYLGVGFNGFGSYSASSSEGMERVFPTSVTGFHSWSDPFTKTVYTLPQNVGADLVGDIGETVIVLDGRSGLSTFFRGQAGVSTSFLSFAGSLSASFQSISKSTSEYWFGMAYAYTTGYELRLLEPTRDFISPEVLEDPDFSKLPATYTEETKLAFFRLFEKYGTHFVSAVRMGGRIFYEASIEKSYGMTQEAVKASLTLEYGAVFSADGKAEWNRLSEKWTAGRQVQVQAVGGNPSDLTGLEAPTKGQNYATQFTNWTKSVGSLPGPVGFSLMGIETLFSGDQYEAVKQASQDYSSRTVRVSAVPGAAGVVVNGVPAFAPSSSPSGVGYAVIDRNLLKLLGGVSYEVGAPNFNVFVTVAAQLAKYQDQDVIVAIVFWNIDQSTATPSLSYPSAALYDFLIGLGAGSGLHNWTRPTGSGDTAPNVSYAIVGMAGAPEDSAFEDFASVEAGEQTYSVDLEVFLRPEATKSGIIYTPA